MKFDFVGKKFIPFWNIKGVPWMSLELSEKKKPKYDMTRNEIIDLYKTSGCRAVSISGDLSIDTEAVALAKGLASILADVYVEMKGIEYVQHFAREKKVSCLCHLEPITKEGWMKFDRGHLKYLREQDQVLFEVNTEEEVDLTIKYMTEFNVTKPALIFACSDSKLALRVLEKVNKLKIYWYIKQDG